MQRRLLSILAVGVVLTGSLVSYPANAQDKVSTCRLTCNGFSDVRRIGLYRICMGARDTTDQYCYNQVYDFCTRMCLEDGAIGYHHFVNGQ